MGKVELLAPAGDMDCFRAAINAGADAVYLGGEEYGARTYGSKFFRISHYTPAPRCALRENTAPNV